MQAVKSGARQLSLFDNPAFYESVDVELKSAKGGVPGSLWETYSAFANTNGGTILLGVAETASGIDIHGIDDPSKVIDNIWSALHNQGKVSSNLLSNDDVQEIDLGGAKPCIKMAVRRANRSERPLYLNNDPFKGTYRRDHTGDYRCTPDEVRRMFADQSSEPADSRILEGFGMDDVHLQSLQQYRNRVASTNANHPWLLEDDRSFLVKLGGWRVERTSNREGLTLAGLLMFGTDSAIRAPEAVPQFHLDYRERLSENSSERWTDRVTIDGTWEANLFQFYNRVLPRLVTSLKVPFQIDSSLYRFDESAVAVALREAVVNGLIHADYAGQGGIVFDRHSDRVELSNPGTLLISHEQLLKGGVSECRNKSLQLMFQLMGAGDKAGSGMDKIRTSWTDARFRSPRLQETQHPDRVALTLPMVSTLSDSALAFLRERFGAKLDSLKPEQVQILVMTLEEGAITNARLQEVLAVHRVDLTKTLQSLVRGGFLKSEGTGRGTRYELRVGRMKGVASSPSELATNEPIAASSVASSVASSTGIEDGTLWAELMELAAPARGSHLPQHVMRELVVKLCSRAGWLNNHQIALLTGRNTSSLRTRVLGPMVSVGLLRLRHPSPTHPYQAYSVADSLEE